MTYDSANENKNYAFFGELSLPVSENLDMIAEMNEDYDVDDITMLSFCFC